MRLEDPFTVKSRGVAEQITPALRERDNAFALRFTGYFSAPNDGIYTFTLRCSPLGRLYLDKDLLVESSGRRCEHQGRVALRRGWHPIEFQIKYPIDENKTLEVHVEGPEMPRQLLGPSHLVHLKTK